MDSTSVSVVFDYFYMSPLFHHNLFRNWGCLALHVCFTIHLCVINSITIFILCKITKFGYTSFTSNVFFSRSIPNYQSINASMKSLDFIDVRMNRKIPSALETVIKTECSSLNHCSKLYTIFAGMKFISLNLNSVFIAFIISLLIYIKI